MNKMVSVCVLLAFACASCASTAVPTNNSNSGYSYPTSGMANNATLAVKDYQPIEIIFVKSTETIDGEGRHTGSKITYEMLMLEAKQLGANDVINIKIDVNQKEEIIASKDGSYTYTKTTYNYTATALAIKYTTAVQGGSAVNSFQNIGNEAVTQKTERKVASVSKGAKTAGIVAIVVAVLGGIIGVAAATAPSSGH